MKLNQLEREVLRTFLGDQANPRPIIKLDLDAVQVVSRNQTARGFVTDLLEAPATKLFSENVSMRWGDGFVAILNAKQAVGLLVYVDSGIVHGIEAYALGNVEWPEEIERFEIERVGPDGMPSVPID